MAEQKECCGTCRFWIDFESNAEPGYLHRGSCRRHTPDRWCGCASNVWCGEYEPVRSKESEVKDGL